MCEPILIKTKEELNKLFKQHNEESEKFILIQFSASWCGPCKQIINKFMKNPTWITKYNGKLLWCLIDIDMLADNKELSNSLPNVTSVPTFYLMKGYQSIGVIKGANENQIYKLIDTNVV
jgi:thioredoxin 1